MSTPSRRARIIAAIADRLEAISPDNGYATSAGATLTVGFLPTLGPDDRAPALALIVGADQVGGIQKRKFSIRLPLIVHGLVVASNDAWIALEEALADVKKAMENLSDPTLGGLIKPELERGATQALARTSGSDAVGFALPYTISYEEAFGDPIGS